MLIDADWCSNKVQPSFLLSERISGVSPVIFHIGIFETHEIQYKYSNRYPLPRCCIVRKFQGKVELVWKVCHLKSFTNSVNFKLFSRLDIQLGQSSDIRETARLSKIPDLRFDLPVTQLSSPSPCLVSFNHWETRYFWFWSTCSLSWQLIATYLPNVGVSVGKDIHPPALPGMKRWWNLQ